MWSQIAAVAAITVEALLVIAAFVLATMRKR